MCDARTAVSLSDTSWGTLTAAQIIAHELGHNFGAHHDAETGSVCENTPDSFLMSPFVNGSGTFSACSIASMAPVIAAARGRCVVAASYADLRVEGPASPTVAYDHTPFDVAFVVTSAGNIAAQQAVFEATLPASLHVPVRDRARWNLFGNGANGVSCALGTLASSASRAVSISVVGQQIGNSSIAATVSAANDFLGGNTSAARQ